MIHQKHSFNSNFNSNSNSNTYFTGFRPKSIRWRLICSLLLVLPLISILISIIAALPLYQQISNEEDKDLQRLASLLLNDLQEKHNTNNVTNEGSIQSFEQEFDAFDKFYELETLDLLALESSLAEQQFTYAIWDSQGRLIESEQAGIQTNRQTGTLNNSDGDGDGDGDDNNKQLHPSVPTLTFKRHTGFVNTDVRFKPNAWRVYYHVNPTSGETIAVAHKWRYRLAYMQSMVTEQLTILLFSLPFLIAILIWSIHRGLKPLNELAISLHKRHAHDLAPMTNSVPTELQPLVASLNQLFTRVSDTIKREQRFTADAAHELRSPITAIKLQANELAFSLADIDDSHDATTSLQRIQQVANRASHLIDQLLTLAQLDTNQQKLLTDNKDSHQVNIHKINWLEVSEEALQNVSLSAREHNVRLKRQQLSESVEQILPVHGDSTLLTLLLRNLLDNAIRYGGQDSEVMLTLADDFISVRDHGQGIKEANIQRVKERFFRPAGQTQMGSGLGLSIVERIAEIHDFTFSIKNHIDGGVVATIKPMKNKTFS